MQSSKLAVGDGRTVKAVYTTLQRIWQPLSGCMNRKASAERIAGMINPYLELQQLAAACFVGRASSALNLSLMGKIALNSRENLADHRTPQQVSRILTRK